MKMEDIPESKKINITVRKTYFWLTFVTALFVCIATVAAPIIYVQNKNYTLEQNTKAIEDYGPRIKNLEEILPRMDEANKRLIQIIDDLRLFQTDLKQSKEDWVKLFRDFDLRRKK